MAVPAAKIPSGVPGFDVVARGGLPRSRTTLLVGAVGTGKSLFACQFLASGIVVGDEAAIHVAADRPPAEVRRLGAGLGLDLAPWEREGRWTFVDATPEPGAETAFSGTCDLGALLARIEAAVARTGARRLALDGLGGLARQLPGGRVPEVELERLVGAFATMGLTALVTSRGAADGADPCPRADAIADNLVVLASGERCRPWRRTVEIARFGAAPHHAGPAPLVIVPGEGLAVVVPRPAEAREAAVERIPSGNPVLDRMLGGGLFRDSVVVVCGPTGAGKTLLAAEFLAGGAGSGDRCLAFSLHESRAQLIRHAAQWGIDFPRMEADRRLAIVGALPESAPLEDHLHLVDSLIQRFEPQRIVIDSVSALDRYVGGPDPVVVAHLVSLARGAAVLLTVATPAADPLSGLDPRIAVAADAIIALGFREVNGEPRRVVSVPKLRGSWHERCARYCSIDANGLHIGHPVQAEAEPAPPGPDDDLAFAGRFPGDV